MSMFLRQMENNRASYVWSELGPFTPSVSVNVASTLWWRLQHSSHWNEWSRSKMSRNPFLKWLHCGQWEVCRRSHGNRYIDANAWCKWALKGLYLRLKRFEQYGGPDLTVGLLVVRVVSAPQQPVRDAHQIRLHLLREVFDLLRLLVRQFIVDREEVEQQHGGDGLTVPTQRVLELSLQRVLAGLVKTRLK